MIVPLYAVRCDHCGVMTAAYASRGDARREVIQFAGWAWSPYSGHACPGCRPAVDARREAERAMTRRLVLGEDT